MLSELLTGSSEPIHILSQGRPAISSIRFFSPADIDGNILKDIAPAVERFLEMADFN